MQPKSNQEWIWWGEHDPLFSVVTYAGREAGGSNPWTVPEFLETGRKYFIDVAAHWIRYGIGSKHCVEIGCGAGRLTNQLVDHFAVVTALDVSPAQIQQARKHLGDRGRQVTFELVAEPKIPLPDGSCDGVFSCEVFQHLDSDAPLISYIREAHRVLFATGTMCVHVPVAGLRPPSLRGSAAHNAVLRLFRRLGRRRMMIYRQRRAESLLNQIVDMGFVDVEMQLFQLADHGGFHPYFMARKA